MPCPFQNHLFSDDLNRFKMPFSCHSPSKNDAVSFQQRRGVHVEPRRLREDEGLRAGPGRAAERLGRPERRGRRRPLAAGLAAHPAVRRQRRRAALQVLPEALAELRAERHAMDPKGHVRDRRRGAPLGA